METDRVATDRDTSGAEPVRSSAQTLERGLQVLEAVISAPEPVTATEIAQAVGIHRTVAHRLAKTLLQRGYLSSVGNGRYSAGMQIWALLSKAGDVRAVSRPFLEELAHRTGETVQLVLRSGSEVVFVDGVESTHALRVSSRTGRVLPAHATSVGKAWLATLEDAQVRELYPDEKLTQVTTATVATRSQLLAVLGEVRSAGYAFNQGESQSGVGSVGLVVRDRSNIVRAAMSVAAPLSRLDAERAAELAVALRQAADQVGARLT